MNKYILASSNFNKVLEFKSKLYNIQLISLSQIGYKDKILEYGLTLEDNALIKADTIFKKYNMPTISDDTGLEVNYLDGSPGVFSARYAGVDSNTEKNINKLLYQLDGVKDRKARFRTVICFKSNTDELFFEGCVSGKISTSSIGENGFGYDSVFIPDGHKITFAQMSVLDKNKISHRSIAIEKLSQYFSRIKI